MPASITQTIQLRQVVYSYSEAAKSSEAEFLRLWRIAFRGFKFLGLNGFWEPQTTKIVVNQNNTANYPPDFIAWLKVGQLNAQNEFQTLAVNRSLTSYRDNGPNRISDIAPEITQSLLGPYWFSNNGFYGTAYQGAFNPSQNFGAGSHLLQPGEFNMDDTNRVIILSTNYPYPHVYLMYLSSPQQNMDYEIPMQFEEAMISWLSLEDDVNLPGGGHAGNNSLVFKSKRFSAQAKLAKKMYKPFNIAEAEQYFRESFLYGVKA